MILTIKPFAENENGSVKKEFDDKDWELILDVYERLIRNFKQTFPLSHLGEVEHLFVRLLIFNIKNELLEEELSYLRGDSLDNIVFFGDEEYVIKGTLTYV